MTTPASDHLTNPPSPENTPVPSESDGYKEYKCNQCGWVHAAIPPSAVPKDADIASYLRCFHCAAPSSGFIPAGHNDAPDGCSLQPVVVPGLWPIQAMQASAIENYVSDAVSPRLDPLPLPRRGKDLTVLYLDFDGVLHTQDCYIVRKQGPFVNPPHQLFEHMAVLEECLAPYPEVRIVLSTSWVRKRGYIYAASQLSRPLRKRLIGATFHNRMNRHEFRQLTRAEQVLGDVQRRCPRWWIVLDDEGQGWPLAYRSHLIQTDGNLGLGNAQTVEQLKAALKGSRHG